MRTPKFCILVFAALCFFSIQRQAKAVIIIADVLRYDDFTNVVYGYASTFLTYPESYYYDAGVDSVLADQFGNLRDYGSYLGGSSASVNTQTFGDAGLRFNLQSGHYLGFYFYYCDYYSCGYYDYYGYSFYGGFYPAYYEFQPYYFCYTYYDVYLFAETYLEITVPQRECPPGIYVQLKSDRVSGVLNGTTQTALLGADVRLQAVVTGASDGTYTWTATGVATQNVSGNTNTVNWKNAGAKTVKVVFRPSGSDCEVSATVNVNVVLPTLNSFSGSQDSGDVLSIATPDNLCGGLIMQGVRFGLGCLYPNPTSYQPGIGINFVAQASVPQNLISDPSQSKIKFVQIINTLRKRQVMGQQGYECNSSNGSWMLDTSDPYDSRTESPFPAVADFATANPATIYAGDNPGAFVDTAGVLPSYNYFSVDERFEMYVVYFTSVDPSIQVPLARVRWNWGGEVVYDPTAPNNYRINYGLSTVGPHPSEPVSAFTPYSGNAASLQYVSCGGTIGSGCDPTGSKARACARRGPYYDWDPETCYCYNVGP